MSGEPKFRLIDLDLKKLMDQMDEEQVAWETALDDRDVDRMIELRPWDFVISLIQNGENLAGVAKSENDAAIRYALHATGLPKLIAEEEDANKSADP